MAEEKNESKSTNEKEVVSDTHTEDKSDDLMNNEGKHFERNALIKLKGIPKCDNAAKYNNFMYRLFVEELKINAPSYKLLRSRDKWIFFHINSQEDKKKVLDTIGEKYTFEGRELTVKPIRLRDDNVTPEAAATRVLNEEEALDSLLTYRKMTYPQQLKKKAEEADEMIQGLVTTLKASETKFTKSLDRFPKLSQMIPISPIDGYVNECIFTIEEDVETKKTKVGIRVKDNSLPYIVPVEKCLHIARPIIEAVQDFIEHLEEYGLKAHNSETLEGNVMGLICQLNTVGEIKMTLIVPREKVISRDFTQITPPQDEKSCEDDKKNAEDGGGLDKKANEGGEQLNKMETDADGQVENKNGPTGEDQLTDEKSTKSNSKQHVENMDISKDSDTLKETNGEHKNKNSENDEDKEDNHSKVLQELEDEMSDARLLQEVDDEMDASSSKLKEIKAAVIKYFNERAENFGIVSFFLNWTFYDMPDEWYERAPNNNYIVGQEIFKENIKGVPFDVPPFKQNNPNTAAQLHILSTIEKLARFEYNTVVAMSTEMRFLEVYFAKKCKAVVSVHACSSRRRNHFHKEMTVKRGFRNIEFVTSSLRSLEKSSLVNNQVPKVGIIWARTGAYSEPSIIKKFYDLDCRQIILISSNQKTNFNDSIKYLEMVGSHMAATKIFCIDTNPHGKSYTMVTLVEEVGGAAKRRRSGGPVGDRAKRRQRSRGNNSDFRRQSRSGGGGGGYGQRGVGGGGRNRGPVRDSQDFNRRNSRGRGGDEDGRGRTAGIPSLFDSVWSSDRPNREDYDRRDYGNYSSDFWYNY